MEMEGAKTHIRIVAWINIVFSLLYLLGALLAFTGFFTLGNIFETNDVAGSLLNLSGSLIGIVLIGLALPGLIGGIGLLSYQNWARILIIILSVLSLLNFPLGTFFSIYSLWVLFRSDTRRLFEGYQSIDGSAGGNGPQEVTRR
jgi:hypothetical protein